MNVDEGVEMESHAAVAESGRLAEIESQLGRLNVAFAYFMDRGEFEAMINLFTPDAVFERAGNVLRGHDEIREAMRVRPKITARHLLSNFHLLNVTDESAEAVVCATVYHGPPRDDGNPSEYDIEECRLMEFHDVYRRTDDGWRIASRSGRPILIPRKRD